VTYCGYAGRVLFVNLSTHRIVDEPLDPELIRLFIGGRGLGAGLLYDLCPKGADPLGPENPLIFMNGPFEATKVPTASRYAVITKSPLTGIYAYSVASGFWGVKMKAAGYDAMVITGQSEKPVYLVLDDQGCRIREAGALWGMSTFETQKSVAAELGHKDYRVACIGPAGENRVKFAAIISENRSAGRCGTGAVMGSKRLKAVAVNGRFSPPVSNPEGLRELLRLVYRKLREHPFTSRYLSELGTPGNTALVQNFKMLPTRNFRESAFEHADLVSGERLNEAYVTKKRIISCYRCPITCARKSRALDGIYEGTVTEGPEYETIWSLGANCGNSDLSSIIYFDRLCDDLGLDTMSTGSTIAFAMECFENGLLSQRDTGGLELSFGNAKIMGGLIRDIAHRRGLGDLLAEGTREAAKRLGGKANDFAIHVKGLELGGYDPRGAKGLGLVYGTGNRGGCHHASGYILPEEWQGGENRFRIEGKAAIVRKNRNLRMLFDSAILCTHTIAPLGIEMLADLLTTVTGNKTDPDGLMKAAERINCTERAFNVREGISRKDDRLPERILKEGTSGLPPFEQKNFDRLLDEYYRISGWDDNGIPKREYLESLGLPLDYKNS
jgi:aldehyde:ferredoxin oxidoreductase